MLRHVRPQQPGMQLVIAMCPDQARRPEDIVEDWILDPCQSHDGLVEASITASLACNLDRVHESVFIEMESEVLPLPPRTLMRARTRASHAASALVGHGPRVLLLPAQPPIRVCSDLRACSPI